jgi:hypothetical protein
VRGAVTAPPLLATGTKFHATVAEPFSAVVANFDDPGGALPTDRYAASID